MMARLGPFEENTIVVGDCLNIMARMPIASVDLVVTDPPYQLSTTSAASGKLNRWADLCNSAHWFRLWYAAVRRILEPRGAFWTFLSWRTMVTVQKAALDIGWQIESLLVWDKDWIGPGGKKGLRPSYELVALFGGDKFALKNRGLYDIQKFKWSGRKPSGHPAEKPQSLIRWLIEISGGDLIFDPFIGSGTTAVVADRLGRKFFGCDINPDYVEMALERLEKDRAGRQLGLC